MSTLTLDDIAALLVSLDLDPLPSLASNHPAPHLLTRPVDIYRVYLADILAKLSGCETHIAYDAIQTPSTLAKGDLILPVPRLSVKSRKPNELCAALVADFPESRSLFQKPVARGIHLPVFFAPRCLSRLLLPYIFDSGATYGTDQAVGLRNSSKPHRTYDSSASALHRSAVAGEPSVAQTPSESPSDATNIPPAGDGDPAVPEEMLKSPAVAPSAESQHLFAVFDTLSLRPGDRKKVIVEFSSPNIAKEFHAGHLRSTIIGAYIANLHKAMGWEVVKINYLGDWGKQFGLLAVGWQRFGSEEELARDPLKHLLNVYTRINALFKPEEEESRKASAEGRDTSEVESRGLYAERNSFFRRMEDGDAEALALWQRFRDISVERYISTYARLNIDFDEYSGESQVQSATIEAVEKTLKDRGIYEEKDGSWVIDFEKYGAKGLGFAVVRGRTGTTTYLLRDVAAVLEREEKYAFDKMIYVVSSEQDLYFKRIFKTLELMGRADLISRLQHVNFGKVLGMSSRLGNVKLLGEILDQSSAAMHEVMRRNTAKYEQVADPDAVAEAIGITAVMVQDMSGKRINNYPFDITRMTSFEGDTGPYLQYCHARLRSILRKAGLTRDDLLTHLADHPGALDADAADKPHCVDLLRLMAQYPDVTVTALRTLEPSTILTYLFRLTHQLSSCYDVIQVVGAKEGRVVMVARAALYEGARQILENGMRLLGLTPVDRM